jgi:hypothetical protein
MTPALRPLSHHEGKERQFDYREFTHMSMKSAGGCSLQAACIGEGGKGRRDSDILMILFASYACE